MGIPDHLTCLLRNLYSGQEETVRTGCGTMDWFQIREGVRQGCIFHPAYLTSMQNTLCEMPGWMKLDSRFLGEIATTWICRCTTLMEESKEELKSLLMKVKKESEKAGLKCNIQKTMIMASNPITSWKMDGGKNGNSGRLYFLGLQNQR